jgi:acyl dehydratase
MNTMARCYEDFAVGEVVEAGPVVVTADAIKAFAAQFDPQPSYLNDTALDAAVAGQVASVLHITCLNMRLLVEAFLCDTKAMGSPGVAFRTVVTALAAAKEAGLDPATISDALAKVDWE